MTPKASRSEVIAQLEHDRQVLNFPVSELHRQIRDAGRRGWLSKIEGCQWEIAEVMQSVDKAERHQLVRWFCETYGGAV